jgi:serine/threonine-protein kinase
LPLTPLPTVSFPQGRGEGQQPGVPLDWDDDVKTTVYDGARAKAGSSPPPYRPAGTLLGGQMAPTPGPPPAALNGGRVLVNERAEPAPAMPAHGAPPFGGVPSVVGPPAARTGHAMPSMPRHGSNNDPTQLTRATPKLRLLVAAGVGLLVVLALVAVGVVALFSHPGTSTLVVNVKGDGRPLDKAQVFVDGKEASCEALPCRIKDVTAGARSVRVAADGYQENTEVIEAEAKKEKPVTVELRRSARASTGFKLKGSPSVRLFVDGKEVGTLPQEVRDLSPGDHQLKLVSSNLYKPEDRAITLFANQVSDLGTVALKVARGRATFVLGKNGQNAKVTLVADNDRRTVTSFPITVELDTARQWTLEASKPGYEDFSQALLFDDGEAERTFTIALQEKGAAPTTGRADPPAPQPAAAPPPPRAATVGGGEEAVGFLNLNSIPPSTCIVDGKTIGLTPRSSVPVSPGSHAIVFLHPELGRKAVNVTLSAGETKSAAVRFP